jgi:hypothetical protein
MSEPEQEYSEGELERIAKDIRGDVQTDSVDGLTFDLNDEEIIKVTAMLVSLQEKWFSRDFDLRTQMHFKDEVTSRFASIGFIVSIGWLQANIGGRIAMVPDISIVDRVGGLQFETDHERRRHDALKTNKAEDITPLPQVTAKLLD